MSNRLLPYDTIIKAHEGDPIAIQAVLDRYAGYIRRIGQGQLVLLWGRPHVPL